MLVNYFKSRNACPTGDSFHHGMVIIDFPLFANSRMQRSFAARWWISASSIPKLWRSFTDAVFVWTSESWIARLWTVWANLKTFFRWINFHFSHKFPINPRGDQVVKFFPFGHGWHVNSNPSAVCRIRIRQSRPDCEHLCEKWCTLSYH